MIFDTISKHLGVKYIYEETTEIDENTSQEFLITSETLPIMPWEWIMKLSQAVNEMMNKSSTGFQKFTTPKHP
jgi:hypothetical protein